MGAIETVIDTVTDNRTYYKCPRCKQEVWAYGSFVGTVCWDCPGSTILHGAVKSTDLVTFGAVSTIIDAATDNKTEYRCPRCGVEKWAYGVGIGRPCLECIGKDPFDWGLSDDKEWYNMSRASDCAKSMNLFISDNYNSSGSVVTFGGKRFSNVICRDKLENARYYQRINTNWCCGNNAINICLKMHGYQKQMSSSEYAYNPIGCGWSWKRFYEKNLKNTFDRCSWDGTETMAKDPGMKWGYIDGTDYTRNSCIIMGGRGRCAHYTIVLGVNEEKTHYLVMDQSLEMWLVDTSLMRKISTYHMTQGMGVNLYKQHSVYRVGK